MTRTLSPSIRLSCALLIAIGWPVAGVAQAAAIAAPTGPRQAAHRDAAALPGKSEGRKAPSCGEDRAKPASCGPGKSLDDARLDGLLPGKSSKSEGGAIKCECGVPAGADKSTASGIKLKELIFKKTAT